MRKYVEVWHRSAKSVPLVRSGHPRIAIPPGFKREEERHLIAREFPY